MRKSVFKSLKGIDISQRVQSARIKVDQKYPNQKSDESYQAISENINKQIETENQKENQFIQSLIYGSRNIATHNPQNSIENFQQARPLAFKTQFNTKRSISYSPRQMKFNVFTNQKIKNLIASTESTIESQNEQIKKFLRNSNTNEAQNQTKQDMQNNSSYNIDDVRNYCKVDGIKKMKQQKQISLKFQIPQNYGKTKQRNTSEDLLYIQSRHSLTFNKASLAKKPEMKQLKQKIQNQVQFPPIPVLNGIGISAKVSQKIHIRSSPSFQLQLKSKQNQNQNIQIAHSKTQVQQLCDQNSEKSGEKEKSQRDQLRKSHPSTNQISNINNIEEKVIQHFSNTILFKIRSNRYSRNML